MNGWRSTWALFRVETLLFLREPFAVFFSLAFPLILLLFVGSIGGTEELPAGGRFIDAYMATMIGVTAANVGLMGMSIHIAENRGQGVLKRNLDRRIGSGYLGCLRTGSACQLADAASGVNYFTLCHHESRALFGGSCNARPKRPSCVGCYVLSDVFQQWCRTPT